MGPELTDGQRAACAAIIGAPEAWSRLEDLADHAEALVELLALGLVVLWERPDYPAVTLTPWGAFVLGVEIDEEWRDGVEEREEQPLDRPLVRVHLTERVKVETPVWVRAGQADHPVRLPRHARIGSTLVRPELVPDERPGPEYLTDDAGQPVTVLGVPVRIDRRLA